MARIAIDAMGSDNGSKMVVEAVKKYFWNEEHSCFVSIDAKTGKQCDESICYDSFFPFLWGMLGKEYSRGFNPLFDKKSFKGQRLYMRSGM